MLKFGVKRHFKPSKISFQEINRFWIRFSRNNEYGGGDIYAADKGKVAKGILCPEQTGKAQSCLDCGLCWAVNTTIVFQDHDELNKQRKLKANENSNG